MVSRTRGTAQLFRAPAAAKVPEITLLVIDLWTPEKAHPKAGNQTAEAFHRFACFPHVRLSRTRCSHWPSEPREPKNGP
jgi:hypothetical protein